MRFSNPRFVHQFEVDFSSRERAIRIRQHDEPSQSGKKGINSANMAPLSRAALAAVVACACLCLLLGRARANPPPLSCHHEAGKLLVNASACTGYSCPPDNSPTGLRRADQPAPFSAYTRARPTARPPAPSVTPSSSQAIKTSLHLRSSSPTLNASTWPACCSACEAFIPQLPTSYGENRFQIVVNELRCAFYLSG